MGQREILKMIVNLSSKIDSPSGNAPESVNFETNEICLENVASTSRTTRMNEMTQEEGQNKKCCRIQWINAWMNQQDAPLKLKMRKLLKIYPRRF